MIVKTLSGIPILDDDFGGVFGNRSFLVSGASGTGKTVCGLQFIRQGLEQEERCLYLSTMAANDLEICASALGFSLTPHVDAENLTLLEYESFIPGNGIPGQDMLPPGGFDQLGQIIHAGSIERVVLDTVLPWVSVKRPDRMPEQIFSFIRSFDRLGVTTLMTLPKPVSSMAFKLKKCLEDVVPVSLLLQRGAEEETDAIHRMQVVKYLGEKKLGGKRSYVIEPGIGIRPASEQDISTPPNNGTVHPGEETSHFRKPRFSDVRSDSTSKIPPLQNDRDDSFVLSLIHI